jgi:hypothetical protein
VSSSESASLKGLSTSIGIVAQDATKAPSTLEDSTAAKSLLANPARIWLMRRLFGRGVTSGLERLSAGVIGSAALWNDQTSSDSQIDAISNGLMSLKEVPKGLGLGSLVMLFVI